MVGKADDPGLMVLSLQEIFRCVSKQEKDNKYEVTCSYLEVYNEVYRAHYIYKTRSFSFRLCFNIGKKHYCCFSAGYI